MSLFGLLMNDCDDDPFYGAHFRQMRQMSNVMNSLFSDPFGMMGNMGGPLAIMGSHHPHAAMMPFMPQMNMNPLLAGGLDSPHGPQSRASYSSSTFVMSSGYDGRPQVYSSTSSTQMGPGGVKETRKTVQDSRTGVKMMSIGHHINDRAHIIEKEQNVHSGDMDERQEFINIEEEEADEFNREFEEHVGSSGASTRRHLPALPAPPLPTSQISPTHRRERIPRRPLHRLSASLLALPAPSTAHRVGASARQTYGSLHPQRSRQRNTKHHHSTGNQ